MLSFKRLCMILCCALALPAYALTITAEGAPEAEARVIVKFKAQSTIASADALARQIGVPLRAGASVSERTQVVIGTGISSAALAQRIAAQADVEYAAPDRVRRKYAVPNDPLYGNGVPGNGPAAGQWYLRPNSGEIKSSIDVEPAWNVTIGSPAIVVAVLDTGVRFDHPDNRSLASGGNLLPGYDMILNAQEANDGDGRDADASDPGDWVTQTEISAPGSPFSDCEPEDSSWHGTQTSGLIAALTDNGIGMASVGRTVRVLPVRVLGKCGGFDSDILAGIRWAAGLSVPGVPTNANPARVINLSLGSEGVCEQPYVDVINEITAVGAVMVASAGNAAGHEVGTPGNCPGVIAVGALRHVGTKVGFSNLGPEVAVSAPGGNCVNTAAGSPCLYPILTTTNAGTMGPTVNIYSDSFNPSLGTSFSAPLAAGTAALMFSARPSLAPSQIKQILQATARPFPTTGGSAGIPVCTTPQFTPQGAPIDQLECYCTTSTCGGGMLDAGAAVQAAAAGLPSSDFNLQGLWWAFPAESESGWGINFAHQGDIVFATWFTYDANGKAWWLSMIANKVGPNTYAGSLVETHGPAFNAMPFNPAQVTRTTVGSATLNFSNNDNGTFSYTVNGISQTKAITREVFGALPTCVWSLHPPLASATNYQDLWYASPAESESGWGINLTMQSDVIFATWFTYDQAGAPMWLFATARKDFKGSYSGTLNRTSGPAFNAVPFSPSAVVVTPVGSMTLTFQDGKTATFAYTVDGISQAKTITRQVFRDPGTACT